MFKKSIFKFICVGLVSAVSGIGMFVVICPHERYHFLS